MPLDEASRRLAFLLQRDLRRLAEGDRARVDRGEEVMYDSVSRMATWETRRGDVIGRWYGEVLASYVPADRILRWAWAGRATATHAEVVFREGQTRSVPQLSMSVVGDLDEEEATALVRIGVLVARGEGLQVRRAENELTFVGLFDSPRPRESVNPSHHSVPPPPVSRSWRPPAEVAEAPLQFARGASPGPATPFRSLPPVQPVPASASRPPAAVREPSRAVFLPVATAALANLTNAAAGFQQGLLVLSVHGERSERLVVMLAIVDSAGVLRSVDPARELVDAAARMLEAERAASSQWRKLSARITPKADGGATFNVDVL